MAVWSNSLPVSPHLVARGVNREQTDFDRLFEEFADPVYGYVLRMMGDPDRAADVVQDTFIKAHRHLGSLTDPGAARSWIFRIATNTAIDALRRGRWSVPMGDSAERHEQRPDPRPGPEAQVVDATLDHRLQRALLALRPNHRQCLLLSDLEDMSAEQIGAVMGLSHGAVRTLLCRARGEMRRLLIAEGMTR